MNDDRRSILDMLAAGKITADEAERLLSALDRTTGPAAGSAAAEAGYPTHRPAPKYLRVSVDTDEPGDGGPTKVNIRVPMQLLRAGVRLSSLIPPKARDEVNAAMAKEGIPFDINQLKPENLEDLVDQLGELTVDVDQEKTKARIFCEWGLPFLSRQRRERGTAPPKPAQPAEERVVERESLIHRVL